MPSLTATEELIIVRAIGDKVANAGIANFSPSPVEFEDKADYFATFDPKVTEKTIGQTPVRFVTLDWLDFKDFVDSACIEQPVIKMTYGLHLFREYDLIRQADEASGDTFLRKTLESEREFKQDVFALRQEFIGSSPVSGLPSGWKAWIRSIAMPQYKQIGPCKYIGSVRGYGADLQTLVEVEISDG